MCLVTGAFANVAFDDVSKSELPSRGFTAHFGNACTQGVRNLQNLFRSQRLQP